MSIQDDNVNDTIVQMITNLKPRVTSEYKNFELDGSLKRSHSMNSTSSSVDEETTPVKKIKHELNLKDLKYVGSPREMRRLRADLLEARNAILNLENRIKHMHSIRKEMEIMFDNETRGLRQQHEYDRKRIDDLEAQLLSVRQREADARDKLSELTVSHDILKVKHSERIEELEKCLADLKEERNLETEQDHEEINALRRKVTQLEIALKAAQEDVESQQQLSAELKKNLSQKNSIERDLELKEQALQKAHLRIKELEFAQESYSEYQQQAKTQQHKLATYSDLEKENQRLKEENQRIKDEVRNKLLLEEEVHNLKNRLVSFKEHERKLTTLQVTHSQIEMSLEEWRAVARGICESTGTDASLPHSLRKVVERLQQQEINLTSDKVQLESQLNTALHEAKLARSESEKGQKRVADLQKTVQQSENLIRRMQKKLQLVIRERDSYRLQLDSYERDLTVCLVPASSGAPGVANQQQTQRERIENLERIVEGYRDMVTKLENDIQKLEPGTHTDVVPVRAEQTQHLQEEVDTLKSENQRLRERCDQLEIQLERFLEGQDKFEGHVYHPEKNPLSECLEQRENRTEKLQEEVERLKRKIKNMEEGLEGSKLDDMSMCSKDVQTLKEQIKTLETQNQRLKDYFKSSMQEFRNVVYMLMGYKVDKTSNSQYKLTSMYAESANDQLCFKLNAEGAMDLLENQFSATLEDMVDLHLRHQNSIPVFLSAITMDLFNNRTMTTTKTFEID